MGRGEKGDGARAAGARLVATVAVTAVVGLLGVSAIAVPAAAKADGCPNEARRVEQGVSLPECRAYELVTPPAKGSGEPKSGKAIFRELEPLRPDDLLNAQGARAAVDGGRMAWVSEPLPSSASYGTSWLSARGPGGWSSEGLIPPMSISNDIGCSQWMSVTGWSPDLSKAVLDLPAGPPAADASSPQGFYEELECGHEEPRLVPGEPEHFRNLFLHDTAGGSNQLINVTPAGTVWPEPEEVLQPYWPASFLAASDDLSHVVFEEELKLTPDAPLGYRGGDELYEWVDGAVRLVTVLEDANGTEVPVHGSLAGATRNYRAPSGDIRDRAANVAQFQHAVSSDGARIFFEAPGDEGEGDLYLRENGERTIQVDAAEAGCGPCASGGGDFRWASADGSRVFFTDDRPLTADSSAEPGKPDLYEYDVPAARVTDLTVNAEPADVLGVAGVAADGSRVYFVAEGKLSGRPNSHGDLAVPGAPNLYVDEGGAISFVATLDAEADQCDWTTAAACNGAPGGEKPGLTSRTSADGRFIAFNSVRGLTGYDNTSADSGEPLLEVYLYDAVEHRLTCASCAPGGAPMRFGAAIDWPSTASLGGYWNNLYPQRNLSDGGQVFFETADALVPADVNGRRDVYEYANGKLSLISSGTGESGSFFLDATPDGNSVFFLTAQRLLPRDVDTVEDIYVARVGGGFPEASQPGPACDGSSCRGPAAESPDQPAPGTGAFAGKGNLHRGRNCRASARRAKQLSRSSRRLRRRAGRLRAKGAQGTSDQRLQRNHAARRLARSARRRSQQARHLARQAKRCARPDRRTAR